MTGGLVADVALRRGPLDLRVALDVPNGATAAVVGPNGAGKTTLLSVLAGVLPPDHGRIDLDGSTLDDTATGVHVPPERRRVGVVFQEHRLFPHLSARENVAFGLRAQGVPRREARATAATWLADVGLAALGAARPHELSGGQAQRVALVRALATAPRLLLLDEPLSALDATTRRSTRQELRRHLRAFPGVAVVVTHDPVDALALADHLVVLEAGRIVQQGSAADIAARPASRYVADLVGVNLYRGRVDAGVFVVDGGGRLANASDTPAGDDREGDEACAVIHPHAVSLHRRRPEGSARNVWPGRITDVDREGVRVRVAVAGAGGDGPPRVVAEVTPAAVDELGLREDVDVWVTVKATEVHVHPA